MNDQQTPNGTHWEPPAVPAWHPEHTLVGAAPGAPSTTTAAGPLTASPPAASAPPRRALPARVRQRVAAGAAATALLAIGGAGGYALGSAAVGDGTATTSVLQPGTADGVQGGVPGTLPGGGQGLPGGTGGLPGTPPGLDDGTTGDGTTGDSA
ncbi:hypothetical protein ACI8AA_02345 [Geodermatophilus sp. SYSU D01180]